MAMLRKNAKMLERDNWDVCLACLWAGHYTDSCEHPRNDIVLREMRGTKMSPKELVRKEATVLLGLRNLMLTRKTKIEKSKTPTD